MTNLNNTHIQIEDYYVDYELIIENLRKKIQDDILKVRKEDSLCNKDVSFVAEEDYKCDICFDSTNKNCYIKTLCGHNFHKECLDKHIEKNGKICSICRSVNITPYFSIEGKRDRESDEERDETRWVINPKTNRKIKVGGKTYKMLKM